MMNDRYNGIITLNNFICNQAIVWTFKLVFKKQQSTNGQKHINAKTSIQTF